MSDDTTEEIRDAKDAFKPGSPHWGNMLSPVAVVIPATCEKCGERPAECLCGTICIGDLEGP